MAKSISILGCGWLGFPLGKHLILRGHRVKGSARTTLKRPSLEQAGFKAYQVELKSRDSLISSPDFFKSEILIVSIPPGRKNHNELSFISKIEELVRFVEESTIKKVLFISSTSVYNENGLKVKEEDVELPKKSSGRSLLKAEKLLSEHTDFQTTNVRFGGLIGADRNPARFINRTKKQLSAHSPVNLIHLDDCISILTEIIEDDIWGETFNACCPIHPTREELYARASEISGLPLPELSRIPSPYKIVDSSKLIKRLNFSFKYVSPLDYIESLSE